MLRKNAFGIAFALAASIGGSIAMGILIMPQRVAAQLPDTQWFFALWIAGAVFAFLGCFGFAELCAMSQRSGGFYIFARRGFGEYPGFVTGWMDWLVICSANCIIGIVLVEEVGKFSPWFAENQKLAVSILLTVLAALQYGGSKFNNWTQILFTIPKVVAFVLIVGVFFFATPVGPVPVAEPREFPAGYALFAAIIVCMQGIWPTYGGWEIPIYYGEEVKDPGKTIPRALLYSVLSCNTIYLSMMAALVFVIPVTVIAMEKNSFSVAATVVLGKEGGVAMSIIAAIIMLSAVNACTIGGPRVLYAMAKDGLFARQGGMVTRNGTPIVALTVTFAVTQLLLWLGSFKLLIAVLAFFQVGNYAIAFAAVFVLRHREPNAERPYRAWGHPYSTGIVLAVSLGFVVGALITDWDHSKVALLLLAVSYPVYLVSKPLFQRMSA